MAHELVDALVGMRQKDALRIVEEMLDRGEDPQSVLDLGQEAMQIVGDKFEEGSFFLPELMMSGEMLKMVAAIIKPRLAEQATEKAKIGTVVLGTVRGDIHDIGKDIVGFVLDMNGFKVVDLGINVAEEAFVEAVKEHQPQVLALSGFLSLAFDSMKSTVDQVRAAGFDPKVIIGGGQIDDTVRAYTSADAYGGDAMAAVAFAKQTAGVS
ncbi:MAG: cobalamin-dependent protein [Actinobacteria bacterium]|nr:cobalamin-dependent protein [Actinomycetota bacterium]